MKKTAKSFQKKAKARALRILQGNPLQKKRGKVKKNSKKSSKKQKRERLKATGSLCEKSEAKSKKNAKGLQKSKSESV